MAFAAVDLRFVRKQNWNFHNQRAKVTLFGLVAPSPLGGQNKGALTIPAELSLA
jgi:hypothetical protein